MCHNKYESCHATQNQPNNGRNNECKNTTNNHTNTNHTTTINWKRTRPKPTINNLHDYIESNAQRNNKL